MVQAPAARRGIDTKCWHKVIDPPPGGGGLHCDCLELTMLVSILAVHT